MTDTKPRPFDERAALEQLEQLAEKIQTTRRQRERAVTEFNAFVKTFKDADLDARASALQSVPRPQPRTSAPPSPVSAAPAPAAPAVDRRGIEPPAVVEASAPAAVLERPASPASEPSSWSAPNPRSFDLSPLWQSPRGRLGIAAAVVVLALIATWLWRGLENGGTTAAQPAAAPAAQAVPETPKPAEPTPVASTGPPDGARGGPARALNIVLLTSRPVWTRVTVDDRKVIEREIAGSQTIPLGADRAITIRAGDAGAIKLVVDGKDLGVMGRDGQIASRTFSAPAVR